ncbi:MAG: carboxypeptidase regulatory-like domain-containing protein [Polyangiaceae bacterium]
MGARATVAFLQIGLMFVIRPALAVAVRPPVASAPAGSMSPPPPASVPTGTPPASQPASAPTGTPPASQPASVPTGTPPASPPDADKSDAGVAAPAVAAQVAEGPGAAPARTFVLRGFVRDPLRAPIDGAVVEVLGASDTPLAHARSDANGSFALPPLAPGAYQVAVSDAAFAPATASVELGPTTELVEVTLEFRVVEVKGDRALARGQTGSSVAALSRKEIQALPGGDAQTLTQIVLTQPGFAPDTFGPDGVLHIRGAEMGVVYVVDGIPLPGGLAGQFGDVLPTRLVQNMRLFTGGMPVEYGPNSGGVVDITTRRGAGSPAGEVQMVYGTYQRLQPSAWYSQAFGKADVFVQGTFLSTQRGLDPPAATPIIHDRLLSGNAFARVDYRPNGRERIELLGRYSQYDFQIPIDPTLQPPSDAPTPGARPGYDQYGNAAPQFVPYDANPTEVERDLFIALSYLHTFSSGSFQLAPYVRSSYGNLNCDPAASLGATAYPQSSCSNVSRGLLHEGQTAIYTWTSGVEQSWKAGLLFDAAQSRVDYRQFTRDDSSPLGGVSPDPLSGRDDTSILAAGAFLQDEITLGKAKLFPGLRADIQDAAFRGTNQPNLLLMGPSARLGLSYAFSNAFVLHAFFGYLWQPPGAVDAAVAARVLVPPAPGQPLPAVDIKAETDGYGEIGAAYRMPKRFAASLTAYGRTAKDQLDVLTVGSTNVFEDYNYQKGRAAGVELALQATANKYVQGFGNASWNLGQGKGIDSARYLFSQTLATYAGWQTLDHVQTWTANAGIDLHDDSEASHLSVLFQFGSGLRTGPDNNQTVPGHSTWNLTLRHRFDFALLHPELAVDILNVFDAVYAIRIANGLVGSAYGPLRQVDVRFMVPLGG